MSILNKMTKAEIIEWVSSQFHFQMHPPKKSDLFFIRWQKESKRLSVKRQANADAMGAIDLKKRDEYARRFNASSDVEERTFYALKIEPYDKELMKCVEESKRLTRAGKRLDRLYDQIDIERKKERGTV